MFRRERYNDYYGRTISLLKKNCVNLNTFWTFNNCRKNFATPYKIIFSQKMELSSNVSEYVQIKPIEVISKLVGV